MATDPRWSSQIEVSLSNGASNIFETISGVAKIVVPYWPRTKHVAPFRTWLTRALSTSELSNSALWEQMGYSSAGCNLARPLAAAESVVELCM